MKLNRLPAYLRRLIWALYIPAAVNCPLIIWLGFQLTRPDSTALLRIPVTAAVMLAVWAAWIYLNIFPCPREACASWRLAVMEGGRQLCRLALYGLAVQALGMWLFYPGLKALAERVGESSRYGSRPELILWGNCIYALVLLFTLLWNGILRMFFTSKRLRLGTRVLMFCAMWIPAVNLVVLCYAMRKVHAEYDFECYKESVRLVRRESELCRTRYPLVMVHGVGFRDLRYFNYWGRIPRELTRYGATVFYGNQEAFATVEQNAGDILKVIRQVAEETGCGKVNIIAHSKGGLDSRYAISCLGAAPWVASLTTISTPHRGCRFVDGACRLPEWLYRGIARIFDWGFGRFGDAHPDFYRATRQFSTGSSEQFNRQVPDAPGVYYQSYATAMRDFLSDPLLSFPYLLIKPLEGENDGLVSVESAKWGEFQGVVRNCRHRGISHGDIIDLKREDYKDFDVTEFYVGMVAKLREKGF
ncbi:MAG: triacylglycerol lipase [Enterocloster asparagiformis]|nr:triacylglycerol lipase [Enterocloster asparagiformis]